MDMNRFNRPPVEVGEELDVTIESVGAKGDGIAKKNGFVIFVPGTKEGDQVRVRINKVLRKVSFADVVAKNEEESGSEESSEEAPEEGSSEEDSGTEEESGSEESSEEAPEEAPKQAEPSPEDTEDFGSDLDDEEDK